MSFPNKPGLKAFGPYEAKDFPMTVRIQYGAIFPGEIEWSDPVKEQLEWIFDDVTSGKRGWVLLGQEEEYHGWDEKHDCFCRYDTGNRSVLQNEHCFRIMYDIPQK
jgi:hypothetical protein